MKHRPIFRNQGSKIVATFCLWELIALTPGSPVPTISATVRKHRIFGVILLAALADHWYLEADD